MNNKMPRADVPYINGLRAEISPKAAKLWNRNIAPKNSNTIEILGVIGESFWEEGITAKEVSASLKNSGDITVSINSPGGDFFEGLAIYNLLREHSGNVTIEILGVAGSAASIIAMAGDEVKMAKSGFLMIHNTWLVAGGDRREFENLIRTLETFDSSLAEIYQARTGLDFNQIQQMLDAETWINGKDALADGFIDNFLSSDDIGSQENESGALNALRQVDSLLARANTTRSERRELLNQIKGTQDATDGMQDAAELTHLREILTLIKGNNT